LLSISTWQKGFVTRRLYRKFDGADPGVPIDPAYNGQAASESTVGNDNRQSNHAHPVE
jgi:hypothetical protein